MNKMITKIVSLSLVILIILLTLDYFRIISFSKVIRDSVSLVTVILTVFSSTIAICTSRSGFNKFINYIILVATTGGLLLYVITSKLNNVLYVALLCTIVYALMDMLIKSPE
jgi:hypothetical protein